jgi:uncharacterized membrane protein
MALIGRLHPLLIHFPIALVILAAAAETGATLTDDDRWRTGGRRGHLGGLLMWGAAAPRCRLAEPRKDQR